MSQGLLTRATMRTVSTKHDREQTVVERKARLNRSSNGAVNLERMLGEARRLSVRGSMITDVPLSISGDRSRANVQICLSSTRAKCGD